MRRIPLTTVARRLMSDTALPRMSSSPIIPTPLLVGLGVGALIGGGIGYKEYYRRSNAKPIINNENTEQSTYFVLDSAPDFPPSRTITFPSDTAGLKLTLYQYQTCPFCCKVRAMLDFCGISYNIVEVNPVLRTQLKWSSKYKKVPILIVETPDGQVLQLNDSSMIISALYSYLTNLKGQSKKPDSQEKQQNEDILSVVKCYPSIQFRDDDGKAQADIMNKYAIMYANGTTRSKEDVMEERKWRLWADSVFVHTLSPNIYRTLPEAIESFKNFDKVGEWEKNFAAWERSLVIYVGAFAMWMIGKRLQKRHNLKSDVRLSLYEESDHWLKNIKQKGTGDFMGGSTPNLSDLAVYGVLSSIEGCAAFNDLDANSKIVQTWYKKVQAHLKSQVN